MDQAQLRSLLEQVQAGAVDVDAALDRLRHLPFEDLGFAKLDHHRALRHGMPEVVFGKGKTPEQIAEIAGRLLDRAPNVLVTRAGLAAADMVSTRCADAEYFPLSGAMKLRLRREEFTFPSGICRSLGMADVYRPFQRQRNLLKHCAIKPRIIPANPEFGVRNSRTLHPIPVASRP